MTEEDSYAVLVEGLVRDWQRQQDMHQWLFPFLRGISLEMGHELWTDVFWEFSIERRYLFHWYNEYDEEGAIFFAQNLGMLGRSWEWVIYDVFHYAATQINHRKNRDTFFVE